MNAGDKDRIAGRAIIALTAISFLLIISGSVLAYTNHDAPGIAAMVAGAVGGIVAIVLRETTP